MLFRSFTAVLAKGRSNYVCLRRLHKAADRAGMLFDKSENRSELARLVTWSNATTDGSLSDLEDEPPKTVWSEVCAETGNCLGRRSPCYEQCHWQAARRRLFNANLIIANHHLLMADLVVRQSGGELLPKFDVLIVDEAHALERVASEYLGLHLSQFQVHYYLNRLFNPRRGTGFLMAYQTERVALALDRARRAADEIGRAHV